MYIWIKYVDNDHKENQDNITTLYYCDNKYLQNFLMPVFLEEQLHV